MDTSNSDMLPLLKSCLTRKDLIRAILLHEHAKENNLSFAHFNTLLRICSVCVNDPHLKDVAIYHSRIIYEDMLHFHIKPSEASIRCVAKLAVAGGDGVYAFDLVKNMEKYDIVPRLRTYAPAFYYFCQNLDADKAYEVEEHMGKMGVNIGEDEVVALLTVSVKVGKSRKVYRYLHKLRTMVRCVSEETAELIQNWFCGKKASEVGGESSKSMDILKIKKEMLRNGGGWHGLGWIGKGNWIVHRSNVDAGGRCSCCKKLLASVDISEAERDTFAKSIAAITLKSGSAFSNFETWLETRNFPVIVDGANVGLYGQHFGHKRLRLSQLDAVVKEVYSRSGNRWPLVVLHDKRVSRLMRHPSQRNIMMNWIADNRLYSKPTDYNDDWYWLYAAVKLGSLIVTNDEMQDHKSKSHIGNFSFTLWKEKRQIHYTFNQGKLKLMMPKPYTVIIQESENGSWHIPFKPQNNEASTTWLCIRRSEEISNRRIGSNQKNVNSKMTGKRKERF